MHIHQDHIDLLRGDARFFMPNFNRHAFYRHLGDMPCARALLTMGYRVPNEPLHYVKTYVDDCGPEIA